MGTPELAGTASWEGLLREWPLLLTAAGENLVLIGRVSSTQDLARRLIGEALDRGAPPADTLVVAHAQSAGRGRNGRRWSSRPGEGVCATLVVPVADPGDLRRMPLMAGIALATALDTWLSEPCQLKWPNDLLVSGRKIGGLLIDSVTRGTNVAAAIGFGVNWSQTESRLPVAGSTSVCLESRRPPSLGTLIAALTGALRQAIETGAGDLELAREFAARSAHRPGDRISFHIAGEQRAGIYRGIDPEGRLRLSVGGEERLFTAADIGLGEIGGATDRAEGKVEYGLS